MQDFEGKVAFITGAASGIGLGIGYALAEAGMKVMLADIEKVALERAASEVRATNATVETVLCDVSDPRSMAAAADATIAAFGKVHVLCNNAGVSSGGLVEELDDGDWNWVIGVNFLGVLQGCRAFLPHIKRHGEGGHIVNTSSMAGLLGGMSGWGPYNSTKFAVVGLTEVLRQEGRAGGFGASVLCPGGVNTNIYEAPRNRPARFGPQLSKVAVDDIRDALKQGLDPRVVGRLVFEAIRDDRLYVFTDPRMRQLVEQRHQHLLNDFEWAAASQALNDVAAPGSKRSR